MQNDPIVIVSAKRTPLGRLMGGFKDTPAPQLGAHAIKAVMAEVKLSPESIDAVFMGCVLPAGLGQAPARQASLGAGIPNSVPTVTINKVCGSGMQTVIFGHDSILMGTYDIVIAGGMENMSRAPYMLDKAREGYRLGHSAIKDHMFTDGLEDAYEGKLMGTYAENTAGEFNFSREAQDNFALSSLDRANAAIENGQASAEITPITLENRGGPVTIDTDENPLSAKPDKIPNLKPAFKKDGTVTAANASSIADGAAALVLMRRSKADELGLTPLATIHAHAVNAQSPETFTTAPVGAIEKLLKKTGWTIESTDLFEINEAFAVVTLAAMDKLNIPHEKVNVLGGSCAVGHPLGATGARIIVTLLNALKQKNLKRGIAALCIGGGEATAIAVERI